MRMSNEGLKLLIKSEGVRHQVYDDRTGKVVSSYEMVQGYPTIGVGHLIRGEAAKSEWAEYLGGRKTLSESQVMSLLRKDVKKFEDPLNIAIQVPITQSMFDALVHLSFNVGKNARSVKNAVAAVNQKQWQQAAQAIASGPSTSKGREIPSLARRRAKEAAWFLAEGTPNPLSILKQTAIFGIPWWSLLLSTSSLSMGMWLLLRPKFKKKKK